MTSAAIRALVSGYPRRLWGAKYLSMLQVYCDDSHGSTDPRPLYLSSYVMDAERWIEFSDAWDEVLRASPAIDYFKMVEAVGRWGCFEGFSDASRNQKVFALAEVIKKFEPWSLHARINTADFDSILKPHAPPPFRTAYFVLCYSIIWGVLSIHDHAKVTEPSEFIFDDHPGLAAKVIPIFDFLMDDFPREANLIAGKPSFKDDKIVLPLQACDMLAWTVRRQHEGIAAPDFADLDGMIVYKDLDFTKEVNTDVLHMVAEMWKREMPGFGSMSRKEWDAMMQRLHNSRTLALHLAGRLAD